MIDLKQVTLTRPDDWHLHVREGAALKSVVADTVKQFGRAIIMPNLAAPITTAAEAQKYRDEIIAAAPDADFEPLMTLYLTDKTTPDMIREAKASGIVYGLKLYPAGATTHSDKGVTDIENIYPALEAMQKEGLLLLVHGEVTEIAVDIFDREKIFIETKLKPLIVKYPDLKIVLEHITTADAVEFIYSASKNLAATITAHHLLMNRNAIFAGGIRPHHFCLPILKREVHRQALVKAATSGNAKFFLGTDSAPHVQGAKESACGCAGIYTAYHAMELYTEAFDNAQALDKLEAFASFNGADFYGLPRNHGTISLIKEKWEVPKSLAMSNDKVIPLRAGESCEWKMIG